MRSVVQIIFALCLLVGCNTTPQNESSSSPNNQANPNLQVQQTAPEKPVIRDRRQVRERLEQLAESIPQVNGANCVVIGNTAIVGIDVAPDLDRARVDVIKYSVAEALRKDPYGVYAFVTADMDLNGRIREIRGDLNQGRPIAGFVEELADIIGRIVPQIPNDLPAPNRQPGDPGNAEMVPGRG